MILSFALRARGLPPKLVVACGERLLGEDCGGTLGSALFVKVFDESVFDAMERNDGHPSAGSKLVKPFDQALLQRADLVVDGDAECPERSLSPGESCRGGTCPEWPF